MVFERRVTRQELIAEGNLYEIQGEVEAPPVGPSGSQSMMAYYEAPAQGQVSEQVTEQGGLRSWVTYGDVIKPPAASRWEVQAPFVQASDNYGVSQVMEQGGSRSWVTYGDIIQPPAASLREVQAPVGQVSDNYGVSQTSIFPSVAPTTYLSYAYERAPEPAPPSTFMANPQTQVVYNAQEPAVTTYNVQEPVATTTYNYNVQEPAPTSTIAGAQTYSMYSMPAAQVSTSTLLAPQTQVVYNTQEPLTWAPTQSNYNIQEVVGTTTFAAPPSQLIYNVPPTMPVPTTREAPPTEPLVAQGRGSIFDMLDSNHDGVISRQEWEQATGTTYLQPLQAAPAPNYSVYAN